MYINLMVTTKQKLTNKRYTKNKKKEPKLHTKEKGNQYILINNYYKCKWIKYTKRQGVAKWIKNHNPSICGLQETHSELKDTYKLKVKIWKNILHANENKAGEAILILDKINFKQKM